MRARVVIACVVAFLVPRAARADDAARIKAAQAMLAAQAKAIAKDDDDALRATLTADALVELPQHPNGVIGAADLSWGYPAPEKAVIKQSKIAWVGEWGWIAADVRITTRWYAEPPGAGDPHPQPTTDTYHWLAIVVPDGAGVKTRALFLTKAIADKDLGTTRESPVPPKSPGPLALLTADPKAAAAQLAADAAVYGTGESERGLGGAAARKLVAGWKSLQLTLTGAPQEVIAGDLGFAFTTVNMQLEGKKEPFPLAAFVVAHKTAAGAWEIVALGYGGD